jgi:hypothetical protein
VCGNIFLLTANITSGQLFPVSLCHCAARGMAIAGHTLRQGDSNHWREPYVTFDFAPDAIEISSADMDHVQPSAPAIGSMAEVAQLVEELFAEGSLSFEQLRSLSAVPELTLLLGGTLADVPIERRSLRKP